MLFTHASFLFYFLPVALFLHWRVMKDRSLNTYPASAGWVIFLLTLVYYGSKVPWWLIPFSICLVLNYFWAQRIHREEREAFRKVWLSVAVFQNLGLLSLFKYSTFFGLDGSWLLPAGISFYTFEALSFVVDVYRRQIAPPERPLNYFVFLSMFPRFIAGPIVRYKDLANQFEKYRGMEITEGLFIFIVGLFLKVGFADSFAIFVDYGFGRGAEVGFISAWVGVFAYSMQIYFDFSGYSLMAIGLGRCFGFQFATNFNRPYLSTSFREFWTRWHMSFTSWIRDYVYTPLAIWAMRRSKWHFALAVIITVILSGVWHGAGWTFILWGAWHGCLLTAEKMFAVEKWYPKRLRWPTTFLLLMISWVFFRATDLQEVKTILIAMASPGKGHFNPELFVASRICVFFSVLGIIYCFWGEKQFSQKSLEDISFVSLKAQITAVLLFVIAILMSISSWSIPFLYFRF